MIKILCDKCEVEIDQREGGGTFNFISKETILDPKTKQIIPRLKQEEYQLCVKHSEEIIEFIKNKDKKI